ncbi:hypothetical protein ACH4CD_25935 [Streptomyces fungicidicus]|uniref:hypothetical protein n=1 Tax=Streptomyces fungicidicus TaxID=68203 RepID=UPI0037BE0F55
MTVRMLAVFAVLILAAVVATWIAAVTAVLARAEGASYTTALTRAAVAFAAVVGLCAALASAGATLLALG